MDKVAEQMLSALKAIEKSADWTGQHAARQYVAMEIVRAAITRAEEAKKAVPPPPRNGAPAPWAVLKAVEWGGMTDAHEGGYVASCPSCGAEQRSGAHADGCALVAAITTGEGSRP